MLPLFPGKSLLAALLAVAMPSVADVIILKNGRRIPAGTVSEEGSRISYETDDGRFSLPKSLVERIEKSGPDDLPAGRGRAVADLSLPPAPAPPSAEKPPILPDGEVNRDYLEQLSRQPAHDEFGRRKLAALYLAAIDYETKRGRTEAAVSLAQRGISALPQDPQLMLAYGILLLHTEQYQAAREWLGRARLAAPDSPLVWKYLGFAEYASDRTDEAMRAWRKSLTLAPDPRVQQMLEKAQRETSAEARYEQAFSSHFNLRFEGREVTPAFRREILEVLERHYQDLDGKLGASLREPIPVILYTEQAFRDVTRAPDWSGAIYDGRVRVGVQGLSSATPQLSATFKHEMVHAFVRVISRDRCPTWLNEGLAQLLTGSSAKGNYRFTEWWKAGNRLLWAALEKSFGNLDPQVVPLAYAQSLAAVEFLAGRYGLHEVVRVLARIAEGQPAEAALQSVYRFGYTEIDQGIAEMFRSAR